MRLKTLIAFIITIVFGYLAIRNVRFVAFVEALRGIDPVIYVAGLPLFAVSLFLRAVRWRAVLGSEAKTPAGRLFAYILIGMLVNDVITARVGEFYRPYLVSRNHAVPYPRALASVIVERIFDGVLVVALLALALSASGLENAAVMAVRDSALAVFGVALGGLLALLVAPAPMLRLAGWLLSRLPRRVRVLLSAALSDFVDGVVSQREVKTGGGTLLWSLALWAVILLSYHVVLLAFGFDPRWWWSPLVVAMASLAVVLPAAPGYIGVYHLAVVMAMGLIGVSESRALALAVVLNLTELLLSVSLGLFYMSRLGLPMPGRDVLAWLSGDDGARSKDDNP